MIDYSKYDKSNIEPEPSALVESFRAIGYSPATAVADIIDNSITANARTIKIDFEWKGKDSSFWIQDDGKGMTAEEIEEAMRLGSKSPEEIREKNDLGRFGLGLKTASFSQCRQLTVISKVPDNQIAYRTWNLDHICKTNRWELLTYMPSIPSTLKPEEMKSGTIILWKQMDRLIKDLKNDTRSYHKFLTLMEKISRHLSMVFHRFIEKGKIRIIFRGNEIKAWDPFLINHPVTQPLPTEPGMNGVISMKGYILPHKSRLKSSEFKEAEGPGGWVAQQGFYIYRNNRLLVPGGWLGMFNREEYTKLVRISIDLPNYMDNDWQIDIKNQRHALLLY